jgi:hypothetical protein
MAAGLFLENIIAASTAAYGWTHTLEEPEIK